MKNFVCALVLGLSLSVSAFADRENCLVVVDQQDGINEYEIGNAITSSMLASRDLSLSKITDPTSLGYDYALFTKEKTDSKGRIFMTLNVKSQKIGQMVNEDNKVISCTHGATIFSTTALLQDTYQATAEHLMNGLLSCELLKKMENEILQSIKCSK